MITYKYKIVKIKFELHKDGKLDDTKIEYYVLPKFDDPLLSIQMKYGMWFEIKNHEILETMDGNNLTVVPSPEHVKSMVDINIEIKAGC